MRASSNDFSFWPLASVIVRARFRLKFGRYGAFRHPRFIPRCNGAIASRAAQQVQRAHDAAISSNASVSVSTRGASFRDNLNVLSLWTGSRRSPQVPGFP